MRISKETAENIADEVSKPLYKKVQELNEKLKEKALEYAEASIPKDVMACFMKHSEHFYTRSRVYLSGTGIGRYLDVSLGKALPTKDSTLQLNEKQAKEICKINDQIIDAQKKYDDTRLRLKSTLLGLVTYNRIREQLPELEKHLPIKSSTALMLPIKEVKKDLKMLQNA